MMIQNPKTADIKPEARTTARVDFNRDGVFTTRRNMGISRKTRNSLSSLMLLTGSMASRVEIKLKKINRRKYLKYLGKVGMVKAELEPFFLFLRYRIKKTARGTDRRTARM